MAELDVYYINLEEATDRRRSIEQSFEKSKLSPAWRLNRFDAVRAGSPQVGAIGGAIANALKANWLSHVGCAKAALAAGGSSHVLIVEDDTVFCEDTGLWVQGVLEHLSPDDWDVVYLDAFISNAVDMAWFFKLRYNCFRERKVEILRLAHLDRAFAGAGAYILNRAALARFVELTTLPNFQCAFDLYLRALVRQNSLKGLMIFPFLTTVSECADSSQVQYTDERVTQDVLMNAFRRLVWIGAGPPTGEKDNPDEILTKEVKAFQAIFSPLLTLQLGWF